MSHGFVAGTRSPEASSAAHSTKSPEEARDPDDDGLGEREVYKDLDLPEHIDAMLHEHAAFLASRGEVSLGAKI